MESLYRYISIEGNIGAGKTTATGILAENYSAEIIYEEFEDIPFLPLFYKDPQKYAFALEMSFLHARYEQLRVSTTRKVLVADYHLGKCLVFAENNLSTTEFDLYRKFYDALAGNLPKPDLLIYLDGDVNFLKTRIAKRGRSYEQDIKAEYLLNITERYMNFLGSIHEIPVLILKLESSDMLTDKDFKNHFVQLIAQPHSNGITRIFL